MHLITVGKNFNDIDAFGCGIAYAELLRKEGKEVQTVFIGPLNDSVTKIALEQSTDFRTNHILTPLDKLIYVDISDPAYFAFPFSDESNVVEIYDHHYGFEAFWNERLGDKSHIERVGAAATLIWEEYVKRGHAQDISPSSANLLALAILQNTLNFTSTETNERDIRAYTELADHITLPSGWQERYFQEISHALHNHFSETLENDTKVIKNFSGDQTFIFSQLEITEDPVLFLEQCKSQIDAYWSSFQNKRYLINIADILSKTSLLYSDDPTWLKAIIQPLFPAVLNVTDTWIIIPIHQRKQILKLLQL